MSGHNKWSTIKHKKAAADAKRGKVFTRLAKEITAAARAGGGDADMNPRLRSAITAGKNANMPNDNIDRAVKKGTGELGGDMLEELVYEGFAPGGIAILIDCLSDNRNRTAAEIRNIFTKTNNNMASNGAVARLFNRKARFAIEGEHADEEELMMLLLEADVDVEAIEVDDEQAEIIAPPEAFDAILKVLEDNEISPSESGVVRMPETTLPVTDVKTAQQIMSLMETIEENDDVQEVVSNADFSDEVLASLEDE